MLPPWLAIPLPISRRDGALSTDPQFRAARLFEGSFLEYFASNVLLAAPSHGRNLAPPNLSRTRQISPGKIAPLRPDV
jgi:hypothetical protein